MPGIVALALVAAALAACGSGSAASSAVTDLRISYWQDRERNATPRVWTLRCNPPRGTLPRPARACRNLAEGGAKLFAPTPRDLVCTQIYGGPDTATVSGLFRGKRLFARFSRTDGCQIARWNRLSPWLLPAGGS